MAILTSGDFASFLRPGVAASYGIMYKELPEEWREIFEAHSSELNYEEDVGMFGLGLASTMQQAGSVTFAEMGQGMKYRYVHTKYGIGFIISKEAVDDNKYMSLIKLGTEAMAKSMKQTKETVAANILNRAFSSSYTFADGLSLCHTAHLLSKGGTFQNRMTTDVDLSEVGLEQALIDIGGLVSEDGLRNAYMGMKLIVPRQLHFDAQRILKSQYQTNSANNDINVIAQASYLPQGLTLNHYLTDADAWFIKTDCANGLKMFQKKEPEVTSDTEFTSDNMRFKIVERYSFGATDVRGIYGSAGA